MREPTQLLQSIEQIFLQVHTIPEVVAVLDSGEMKGRCVILNCEESTRLGLFKVSRRLDEDLHRLLLNVDEID